MCNVLKYLINLQGKCIEFLQIFEIKYTEMFIILTKKYQ